MTKKESNKIPPSIGYIEVMNNGRYFVSCGTEEAVDTFWYATTDTEQEAIEALLEDDPEAAKIEGYAPVGEIIIIKDYMFGERRDSFADCIQRVIGIEEITSMKPQSDS